MPTQPNVLVCQSGCLVGGQWEFGGRAVERRKGNAHLWEPVSSSTFTPLVSSDAKAVCLGLGQSSPGTKQLLRITSSLSMSGKR